jgi:Protein of unknown function (DUF2612)
MEIGLTVAPEYGTSPIIDQLIDNYAATIDPNYNLENFYTQCWSLDSASGYGLDRIGRVVGINRTLTVSGGDYLGFTGSPGNASGDSFNAGIFYAGEATTGNYTLTDDSYRQLILTKAAANITNGSIPAINQILLNLFPDRGTCYCIDGRNMTMTYVFDFVLSPVEIAIVTTSNVLPTPAGVLAEFIYMT